MQKKEPAISTPQNTQKTDISSSQDLNTISFLHSSNYPNFTLAIDTKSGLISYLSHPNIVPSLPKAQITYGSEELTGHEVRELKVVKKDSKTILPHLQ